MHAYHHKLLSHRLRGYADVEHCLTGLERALQTCIPNIEVDTRVSKDGEIYLFHDPSTVDATKPPFVFGTTHSSDINKSEYPNGDKVLSLRAALETLRNNKTFSGRFCIDIKDYGYEEAHLELVRENGLEERVCWVSWIPQTLVRLHELGATSPLVFSHFNVFRLGVAGQSILHLLRNQVVHFKQYVLLGQNTIDTPSAYLSSGHQYTYCCRELPAAMEQLIVQSGGGICVPIQAVCKQLTRYCMDKSIQLWIFSVSTTADFIKYAEQSEVDIIFCDDARSVEQELQHG